MRSSSTSDTSTTPLAPAAARTLFAQDYPSHFGLRTWRGTTVSTLLHGATLLALLGIMHHIPRLIVARPPGTARGTTVLTFYSPGGPPHQTVRRPTTPEPSPVPAPALPSPPQSAPDIQDTTFAENGTGSSVQSGFGEGDVQIALPTFSPAPKPSLATMATGTAGDVVLDAVIDEHGHIQQLTLLKGLGPAIDQTVIATVQQWIYTPATRDGKPVASGQELHFHYERG